MKRFALFAGTNHYPEGGAEDFISLHYTRASAMMEFETLVVKQSADVRADRYEWANVALVTDMSVLNRAWVCNAKKINWTSKEIW